MLEYLVVGEFVEQYPYDTGFARLPRLAHGMRESCLLLRQAAERRHHEPRKNDKQRGNAARCKDDGCSPHAVVIDARREQQQNGGKCKNHEWNIWGQTQYASVKHGITDGVCHIPSEDPCGYEEDRQP